jgi:hypothetical protein
VHGPEARKDPIPADAVWKEYDFVSSLIPLVAPTQQAALLAVSISGLVAIAAWAASSRGFRRSTRGGGRTRMVTAGGRRKARTG